MARSKTHTVTVYAKAGYLYLRWRFQGVQKQLACQLPDTPINRTIAESKAKGIELDIATGTYDETLIKYKSKKNTAFTQSQKQSDLDGDLSKSPINVLVSHWLDANYSTWKLNTYLKYQALANIAKGNSKEFYKPVTTFSISTFTADIQKASKQPREVLKALSNCFNWLISRDIVTVNPFEKVLKTLPKDDWESNPKANAFTLENKQRVLDYFAIHFPAYRDFVEFLFLTGCRPSEAVGLTWEQVEFTDSNAVITFDRSISYRNGMAIYNQGSKNNKSRKFPCNSRLTELLLARSKMLDSQGYVFGNAPKNLHYPNFVKRQWKQAMIELSLEHTPYNCRDTFITEQIKANKPLSVICLWCDTSIDMIQRHYLDKQTALEIVPD
jgi:integrase